MKKITALLLTAFFVMFVTAVFAQSRRIQPPVKPVEPLPEATPTPTAAAPPPVIPLLSDDQKAAEDNDVITVDTNLVTIPVKVSDRNNRFVAGLKKEDFKVYEDGEEQEIAMFSNEEQPFTVALVLDMSYSTIFKITEIQDAAFSFVTQLRPEDKVMVISFDEEVHMLCEATNDRQRIFRAIKSTKINTGTSLYEAVGMVLNNRMRKLEGRKAVVLFTDGVDTTSQRFNDFDNETDAQESDSLIYPIQYDTFQDVQEMKNKTIIASPSGQIPSSSPLPFPNIGGVKTSDNKGTTVEEYEKAGDYLRMMASLTGGRIYQANSTTNLAIAFSKIAAELREFYSLGYYPRDDSKAGKKRRLKVKVNRENLSVRARENWK